MPTFTRFVLSVGLTLMVAWIVRSFLLALMTVPFFAVQSAPGLFASLLGVVAGLYVGWWFYTPMGMMDYINEVRGT